MNLPAKNVLQILFLLTRSETACLAKMELQLTGSLVLARQVKCRPDIAIQAKNSTLSGAKLAILVSNLRAINASRALLKVRFTLQLDRHVSVM